MKTGSDPDTWHGLLRQDLEQSGFDNAQRVGCNADVFLPARGMAQAVGGFSWGLGSCWSKDLLNGCRSLVVHRKTGDIADAGQLAHVPSDLDVFSTRFVVGPGIVGLDVKAIGPRPAQHLSGPRGAQHDARADPHDARQNKSAHDIAHLTTVH